MDNSMLFLVPTRREGTVLQCPKTLRLMLGSVLPDNGSREVNNFVVRVAPLNNLDALSTGTLLFDAQSRKILFAGDVNCLTEQAVRYGLFKVIGGCRRFKKMYDNITLGEVCGIDIDDFVYYLKTIKS
jgi:hypothetical protein